MDVPPETPAAAGAHVVVAADAYAMFWDCVENDTPVGDESPRTDAEPVDAYRQFWELSDT